MAAAERNRVNLAKGFGGPVQRTIYHQHATASPYALVI